MTLAQPKEPNAPLVAALEAAKAARLPDHIEAQVSRIGVMSPRPEPAPAPRPMWAGPTEEQPDPPF
mgnify:CR=1 FL=1